MAGQEAFLMTPVFCITDIPSETIDLFLTRATSRAKEVDLPLDQLYIVTSRDSAPLSTAQPTTIPVQSSAIPGPSNPFHGLKLPELRKEFNRLFGAKVDPTGNKFAYNTFIVLDERSLKDESCLLVSCSVDKGEARSDFFLPVEVLTAVEMGSMELNEGMEPEKWKDPEGEDLHFYEIKKWKKYITY